MFAPNLRRKIFGWLERLKNSAGIRLSHKKNSAAARRMLKNSARRLAVAAEGSRLSYRQLGFLYHLLIANIVFFICVHRILSICISI